MLQALRASSKVEPCHPGFPGFFFIQLGVDRHLGMMV